MARPRVIVVGLGPGDLDLVTRATEELIRSAPDVVFRTLQHPAARSFSEAKSFDELYESAESFEQVYETIVDSLVEAAGTSGEVVYVVPGSPVVAERTVELLRGRDEVEVDLRPALSFADLAWGALGIDPMSQEVRFVDATRITTRLRGPGPLLVTQCHSTAVLSSLKLSVDSDMLSPRPRAVILHHLGLKDQEILEVDLDEVDRFDRVDHLTSVYLPELRTIGPAVEDLVDLMDRLRSECPWDQKQTHESLTRHLLEESYELLEALEHLTAAMHDGGDVDQAYGHVQEELGDVVIQVVFHAHLAQEEGRFTLTDVLDGVRTKLIGRHPHVFGDVVAETPDEVAANWEAIKQAEKERTSITEGIPIALPAMTRFVKLRRKANAIGMPGPNLSQLVGRLSVVADELSALDELDPATSDDASSTGEGVSADLVGSLLAVGVELAQILGVDPEAVLRQWADALTVQIIDSE
jgi:tetrapyrrole methylase family protein/MazG family protein